MLTCDSAHQRVDASKARLLRFLQKKAHGEANLKDIYEFIHWHHVLVENGRWLNGQMVERSTVQL